MASDPELLRAIERAVANEPESRSLRLHLIDLLVDDGQHAAALGHCERLIAADPSDTDALSRRAAARQALGIGTTARDADRRTTPRSPTDPPPGTEAQANEPGSASDIAPSDLAEIVKPELTLDDVAGLDDVKARLRLSFLEPLKNEDLRTAFGHTLRASLLLWGPPGCGKTFLAKALAGELGLYFIHLGIADVLDMWVGSSERNLRALFEEAREMSPSVLFIDEIDALGHKRVHLQAAGTRTVVNQLLLELDGAESDNSGVLVLGATNQLWDVDPALLRPGRFDRQVLVLPPDAAARAAILGHHLRNVPTEPIDLAAIAARTDGYSGADLARVCSRAAEFALHASVESGSTVPVRQSDLEHAVTDTPSSTDAWLALATNFVEFADPSDRYTELRQYISQRRGRRRR